MKLKALEMALSTGGNGSHIGGAFSAMEIFAALYSVAYVDDTFEIQVRTNSFEGWHEIEHDMRYKGSAFGTGNEALARKMNSILATLELCDDSVVGLIEDLGHQHYKDRKWNYMLRCHYRLKFTREPLHPYIEEIFDEDTELAKKFYKFKREPLLRQLWDNTGDKGPEITVNNIVKIIFILTVNINNPKRFITSSSSMST